MEELQSAKEKITKLEAQLEEKGTTLVEIKNVVITQKLVQCGYPITEYLREGSCFTSL
jgi:hypothetical protein